jgi:hypothetical protein
MKHPKKILWRGVPYVLAYDQSEVGEFDIEDLLSHDDLMAYDAMETGNAFCPKGRWHPGWEDSRGRKFAEVHPPSEMLAQLPATQYFLRIDNRPGWRWEDDR